MRPGTLYIIATPIGNMGDITLRAIETLKSVDFVVCEDTRVTGSLLHKLGIKKPLKSLHQHSGDQIINEIITLLISGQNIAYVTDSGTPGISDPGQALVAKIRNLAVIPAPDQNTGVNSDRIQNNGVILNSIQDPNNRVDSRLRGNDTKEHGNDTEKRGNDTKESENGLTLTANSYNLTAVNVIPIPGPSAVAAAVSVSGMVEKEYYFAGFLPKKKGRQTALTKLSKLDVPIVIYESAMRVEKTLNDIKTYFGDDCEVFIAREMTKMFEEYWGGNVSTIISDLKSHQLKGEFVLVVKQID